MADNITMSFSSPNYSGLLFRKGNEKTPFSTIIGGKAYTTDHTEFSVGVFYDAATGEQPNISEKASLTAPDANTVEKNQETNVTQIFQQSYGISDAKLSNMGTLSGLNASNQVANPIDEKVFQADRAMAKIAQDVEYTFVNGTYNKATTDATVNKTRGILTAITSNVIDGGGKDLGYWLMMEAIKSISEKSGETQNLIGLVSAIQLMQVQKDALENGLKVFSEGQSVNGIAVTTIVTPFGNLNLTQGRYLPKDTALIFNPMYCAPVMQMVPEKGNFYDTLLGQTGNGEKHTIFGQTGLDYGAEFLHAKITGLKTTFEAPENGVLTRTKTASAT